MTKPGTAHYTGDYTHTLDEKNRLTIPSAWRDAHGESDTFLATPQAGGSIAVLPPAEVEKLRAKVALIALSDRAGQEFAARYFSRTQSFSFDKQGRVSLSEKLLRHAGITKDAVLVGSLTKFNVYSPARWTEMDRSAAGEGDDEQMRRLGI